MAEQLPAVDGRFDLGRDALAWAADDWGHLVCRRPLAVLRPASVADVTATLRFGRAHGVPVVFRGQGHSTGGQAQADGGIVIDMAAFQGVHDLTADRVVVGGGTRWSEVLAAAVEHGRTPPVLTDYLGLSVGGTLSAGGIGGATHQHGFQTGNVLELDVVTPDGTLVTCSPQRERGLFERVLAGGGREGGIVRATLRLVRAPLRVRRTHLRYTEPAPFLADQRRLVGERRFPYLEGRAEPTEDGGWEFVLDVATYYDPPDAPADADLVADLAHHRGSEEVEDLGYTAFAGRLAEGEALLRELGDWYRPHPWLNLFLPDSATQPVVERALRGLDRRDLGDAGVVLIYPFPTSTGTPRPELPAEPLAFLFALLRYAPDEDTARRMLTHNDEIRAHARSLGGTCYLE